MCLIEIVLDRRRSSRGRPFHTDGPLTQKAWAYMRVVYVRANGTERTPFPAERMERPLAIPDTDRHNQLGKLEKCLTSTTTPRRQPCTLCAVGQGASAEPPTRNLLSDRTLVFGQ